MAFFTIMALASIKAQPHADSVTWMPAGVVKISDKPELIDLRTADAMSPMAAVPKAETEHQYTAWEDLDWAKWAESTWQMLGNWVSGENHFKVQKRTATDDADVFQLKFVDPFNTGHDFVLDCNGRSYTCTSGKQESGISCSDYSDATYETFKICVRSVRGNVVSVAGGRIMLSLFFELNDAGLGFIASTATVMFDHAASLDYEVTIPATGNIFGKDKTEAEIQLKPQGDVKMFKYFVWDSNDNDIYMGIDELLTTYADKIQTATDLIRFPLTDYMYEVFLIPCNDKGEWLGFEMDDIYIWNMRTCCIASNADEDCEWIDYGEALFVDDLDGAATLYEKMKVLTRKDAPGKYLRLVNPYGPDVPTVQQLLADDTDFGIVTSEDFYIDIEVKDSGNAFRLNRPIGIYYKYPQKFYCGNAMPIARPYNCPESGLYRWGRYMFNDSYRTNTELVLDPPLRIRSLSCGADGFTIDADDNVAYVKYTIINYSEAVAAYDVADKIVDGSYDGPLLTAQAQPESRAGGKVVKIPFGTEVLSMLPGDRLLAVPYTAGDEVIESYLDAPVALWRGIGNAKIDIDGYYNNVFWFRDECEVEQYGNENKYRLVHPTLPITNPVTVKYPPTSEYLYIDATNPDEVNFSSDGDMGDFTISQHLDDFSDYYPVQINTVRNWVVQGKVSASNTYTYGKLRNGVVTTDFYTLGLEYYDMSNTRHYQYMPSLTITLPDALGAIGDVTVDDNTVTDADAPAEYYNLQGVRVSDDNLIPGIYIVRKGNSVSKILVR